VGLSGLVPAGAYVVKGGPVRWAAVDMTIVVLASLSLVQFAAPDPIAA
jgi:hypothetical protein